MKLKRAWVFMVCGIFQNGVHKGLKVQKNIKKIQIFQ